MGLEQLGNQIVSKLDYINDFENTIRECLFIMKDGFWESKRFELYQKKRERELLDFFYSYYKDTSCENLPESIQELPLYLIEFEYEFISRIKELEERTFRSIKKEGYCLLFLCIFLIFPCLIFGFEHFPFLHHKNPAAADALYNVLTGSSTNDFNLGRAEAVVHDIAEHANF